MKTYIPITLSLFAFLLFGASLSQPAFTCTAKSFMGYEVLMMGWMGLLGADPRWFANTGFFFLLYRTVFQSRLAPGAILVTGLLAVLSFLPAAGCAAPGGAPGTSTGLAIGGYLWVVALWTACVANFLRHPQISEVDTQPMEAGDSETAR